MTFFDRLFYEPESSRNLIGARVIVAAHALWILLSRPCLPRVFEWPIEFWSSVTPQTSMRYLWFFGRFEWPLWFILILAVAVSPVSRLASLLGSLLLYHFAPLEDAIIRSPGPYARGLTVDVIALAILAFAARPGESDGEDVRWPLFLIRFCVACQYLFATVAKVRTSGLRWFSGQNIQHLARTFDYVGVAPYPDAVIGHPAVATLIGAAWLVLSISVIFAPFSKRVAMIVVPLLAIAHVVAALIFGVVWLAAPLLLVFIDWRHTESPNSSAQRASA